MISITIISGSGFVGGELARWVLDHPELELTRITSGRLAGQPLHRAHPHLRGRSKLRFADPNAELPACNAIFLALPHGRAAKDMARYEACAERVIDASADFRLADPANYQRWYGSEHPTPERCGEFVYGLPELRRAELEGARRISGVGCNATAVQLALLPLERMGLLGPGRSVSAQVYASTSESGASPSGDSHHPLRSGSLRYYAPLTHRHAAEVEQSYPGIDLRFSVLALDSVRGALASCEVQLENPVSERDLLRGWQNACAEEPFLDVVHERSGPYRHPEPKLVIGTNRAQLGFALSEDGHRLVAMCALDNLGKGAAGSAVQALNVSLGFEESLGLQFHGIHPL